ncbi:hypothetical protein D3C77_725540 [compost metagenome]
MQTLVVCQIACPPLELGHILSREMAIGEVNQKTRIQPQTLKHRLQLLQQLKHGFKLSP